MSFYTTGRHEMSQKPKWMLTAIAAAIPPQLAASSIPTEKPAQITQSIFDALPDSAFIREAQLVQSPKRPDTPAPLPFSAATLWRKVKSGTFPAPCKLSARVTAWEVRAVRAWITAQSVAD
ncbi:AlpA family transcriptional regulator [Variovorax sp. J22R115]|uniref:helix-turn-helix transcriptional regulator n=1 Tax=Variovorax sp. J22R115 TaxID=3053509 RepID=UPI002578E29A|nr:AlpA family phage regulatory protein [Variovorax sp. J22R115]MDM0051415.1 AlpA family phage regulatory protein [Variovorax sp. J22R115]